MTRRRCVGPDTRLCARVRALVSLLFLLSGIALGAVGALAVEPVPRRDSPVALNAKIVWVASDRVVLASSDSLGVEESDALQFFDRKKPVASGVVTRIYEPGLVAARVTSGSLGGVKKLDHLRVFASRPDTPSPRLLRVGYPSARRSNALFRCATMRFRTPSGYRADATDGRRLIRGEIPDPPWPDTLVAQEFDESGDEEIAFERGELDIAIFWPGELSSSERARLDERNHILAPRATGLLAGAFQPVKSANADGTVLVDSARLESMNRDLFGGDLALIPESSVPNPDRSSAGKTRTSIQADRSSPGWQALERSLNKDPRPLAGSMEGGSIRVMYLDRSPENAPSDSTLTWLFRVRCPVLFPSSLRRVIERWHGESLVDLLDCHSSTGAR